MLVNNKKYQTIWTEGSFPKEVLIIDQRKLPFEFRVESLKTVEDTYMAIRDMWVRGAPLIGVTAAYGMYLACLQYREEKDFDDTLLEAADYLKSSRPTAVNLFFALERMEKAIFDQCSTDEKIEAALEEAHKIKKEELDNSLKIGQAGVKFIEELSKAKKEEPVNILTHCNAGWLACVDYGTATAPLYLAHDKGVKIHVWVDETRPRNQGARLTAWELGEHGIPYTVITDNTGGLLMQQKKVDMVIVGSDRTASNGDVANKIGTYLKALAARHNNIPFYVALPTSTIDMKIDHGVKDIPIEQRDENEVKYIEGLVDGKIQNTLIMPEQGKALNYGFDITPAEMVTALITEKGVCQANRESIKKLFANEH